MHKKTRRGKKLNKWLHGRYAALKLICVVLFAVIVVVGTIRSFANTGCRTYIDGVTGEEITVCDPPEEPNNNTGGTTSSPPVSSPPPTQSTSPTSPGTTSSSSSGSAPAAPSPSPSSSSSSSRSPQATSADGTATVATDVNGTDVGFSPNDFAFDSFDPDQENQKKSNTVAYFIGAIVGIALVAAGALYMRKKLLKNQYAYNSHSNIDSSPGEYLFPQSKPNSDQPPNQPPSLDVSLPKLPAPDLPKPSTVITPDPNRHNQNQS